MLAARHSILSQRASVKSILCPRVVLTPRCIHGTAPLREGREPKPLVPSGGDPHKFKGQVNYFPDFIHAWNPVKFKQVGAGLAVASVASFIGLGPASVFPWILGGVTSGYWYCGISDMNQTRHTVRRNFPVLGHVRYIFETLRPEIYQYFVESDSSGVPFNREKRSQAYQRSKNIDATMPFGTRMDVYEEGYEWLNHSLWPTHIEHADSRKLIGGPHCKQPYSAALLNVSAMSYGALSDNAILALNKGAAAGGFYHNTGEGGISRFHLQGGADVVWNIGTGYFGCRNKDGSFDAEMFKSNAQRENVKMIEIKLSQGAKPAHGGLLPKEKITEAIAEARGLGAPPYQDCNSPPRHSAFSTPYELAEFVTTLRELSGGKPVGMKLCVGRPEEAAALVRAFVEFGPDAAPDFITVDGAEGGTGAAPPEFSNRIGMPLLEGLTVINGLLHGTNLRNQITVIGSGRVVNGFDLVRLLAMGADICNSARAMMFALGCIQALACNTNKCPTGIATSDPVRMAGLDVNDKSLRVTQYQAKTVESALEIVGACGLNSPRDLRPEHLWRRIDGIHARSFREVYGKVPDGSLLDSSTGSTKRGVPMYENWWAKGGNLLHQSKSIGR